MYKRTEERFALGEPNYATIHTTLEIVDALTVQELEHHISNDGIAYAFAVYMWWRKNQPLSNQSEPWELPLPPFGTWNLDPHQADYEVLIELNPWDLTITENEQDRRNTWAFPYYVAFARSGIVPPPTTVVRHVNGHLVSINSRRVLAARDAGLALIPCWYNPTHATGRPALRNKRRGFVFQDAAAIFGDTYYNED
jgi:hypothetical protein